MSEEEKLNINWTSQTEDRPLLDQLLFKNMFLAKGPFSDAERNYLLRATPSEEDLKIDVIIDGKPTEVYVPEFLAKEFNTQLSIMRKAETGYKFWVYRFNPLLEFLGFFASEEVKEISLTENEEKKVKHLEKFYPTFREDFQKYEMIHYFNAFSRLKQSENGGGRQDLENIQKCLTVYYDYFEKKEGQELFKKYYPKNLDRTTQGRPKILSNGDSYVIRVLRPHLSIAVLVQAFPHLDVFSQREVQGPLRFALASAKALPETFLSLSALTKSKIYLDRKKVKHPPDS